MKQSPYEQQGRFSCAFFSFCFFLSEKAKLSLWWFFQMNWRKEKNIIFLQKQGSLFLKKDIKMKMRCFKINWHISDLTSISCPAWGRQLIFSAMKVHSMRSSFKTLNSVMEGSLFGKFEKKLKTAGFHFSQPTIRGFEACSLADCWQLTKLMDIIVEGRAVYWYLDK